MWRASWRTTPFSWLTAAGAASSAIAQLSRRHADAPAHMPLSCYGGTHAPALAIAATAVICITSSAAADRQRLPSPTGSTRTTIAPDLPSAVPFAYCPSV